MSPTAANAAARPDDDRFAHIATLVSTLVACGLEDVCIAPGARSTPLTVAFTRTPGIHCWTHVDERSAGFFALGIAKQKRRAVALVCTSGTAAANFFPAVIEASYARVPLVVLTADRPAELRDREAGQAIDQIKLYGDYPLWFAEVGDADSGSAYFADLGRRAVQTAQNYPCGVVHLNVPLREPLLPVTSPAPPTVHARVVAVGAPAPIEAEIERLANTLHSHPRTLLLCGPRDHPPATIERIAALARRLAIPLLADPASQVRHRASSANIVDSYDALIADPRFAEQHRPDLVVRIGGMPLSKPLRLWLEAGAVPQIAIDPTGAWNDPSCSATEIWHSDLDRTCDALQRILPSDSNQNTNSDWLGAWYDANRRARTAVDTHLLAQRAANGTAALRRLADLLGDGSILYVGNSLPIRQLETAWPANAGDIRILCNRGANGIDGVVSSILGTAAVSPTPVIGVLGDLSFYHDMNGLLAARRQSIDATIVVLNNDGGGIFSMLPQAELGEVFDTHFTTPHGLDLSKAADLYGCSFACATDLDTLTSSVQTSIASKGIGIIEVPFDRDSDISLLRETIRRGTEAVA